MPRTVLGLLAAALWLPAMALVFDAGYGRFWAMWLGLYTVPATLLIAAPLLYVARRRVTLLLCIAAGAAIGLVGAVVFLLMTNVLAGINWAPSMLIAGVLSAMVFWLVGVWRNPYFHGRRIGA